LKQPCELSQSRSEDRVNALYASVYPAPVLVQ
jgi:hypothetical protein